MMKESRAVSLIGRGENLMFQLRGWDMEPSQEEVRRQSIGAKMQTTGWSVWWQGSSSLQFNFFSEMRGKTIS
jgi:hypothetical protein